MAKIVLKRGREKSVLRHHPWIFSNAIENIEGEVESGDTLAILDSSGQFLAWAAYSPQSQIRARIWDWDKDTKIGYDFFYSRISNAFSLRDELEIKKETNAYRLIHAESDRLPGLIVDQYDKALVVQFLATGTEFWRQSIIRCLDELIKPNIVYERSDVDIRLLEGLSVRKGPLKGSEISSPIEIVEHNLKYWVDIKNGHKTGFYLDQRPNRYLVRKYSKGKSVLNCFCYTGGFTTNALVGGALSVVSIDSSEEALELAKRNVTENQLPMDKTSWIHGNVFAELRKFRDMNTKFDLIILDPPKFAQTASQANKAARGYKDINLLALKLLRPGGILFTFSCSGGISPEFFQKIVAGAAEDANRRVQILGRLTQGGDHPVGLNFPEGSYLKGLILHTSD